MNTLSKILAPVSNTEFFDTYFQREPLLIPGSEDKFNFLFRTEDFKCNLDKTDHIRAVFPLLRQAHISISDMPDMLRAGASICVTGMEKAHPQLAYAVTDISTTLNYSGKVSFRAYLSPQGRGFDIHFDARVASTLQIGGRKRWWYKVDPATRYPKNNSPHTEYLEENGYKPPLKTEMESVVLSPGDFLCLPAGAWHCAEAEEDSLSLNLAFDHKNASYGDCLLVYLKNSFDDNIENRASVLSLNESPWLDTKVIEKTRNAINDMILDLERLKKNKTKLEEHLKSWFSVKG